MAEVGQEYEIFNPKKMMQIHNNNWLEVLMDTTTLIATFVLLAFMVERLTNGLALLLGYWDWWRERMEVSLTADLDSKSSIDRNRRVFLFALSAVLAVFGSVLMDLNLLVLLGVEIPATAGEDSDRYSSVQSDFEHHEDQARRREECAEQRPVRLVSTFYELSKTALSLRGFGWPRVVHRGKNSVSRRLIGSGPISSGAERSRTAGRS